VVNPLKNIIISITWRFHYVKKESKEEGNKEKSSKEKESNQEETSEKEKSKEEKIIDDFKSSQSHHCFCFGGFIY